MDSRRRKEIKEPDKNPLFYAFWMLVNRISIALHFKRVIVTGRENLPADGPFLLMSNHSSRWDGLIIYDLIGRPSNFMVSSNELKGVQGSVLRSLGSFPADPRFDLIGHALKLFRKGEGLVVFPEGDIFRDGSTHPFKPGAAKIALEAVKRGIDLPLIPTAISYGESGLEAEIIIGNPVRSSEYQASDEAAARSVARKMSDRMHRELCLLRA